MYTGQTYNSYGRQFVSPHNYTTQGTKVLLKHLTVTQLIKKLNIFYAKQRFMTVIIQPHFDTNPQP